MTYTHGVQTIDTYPGKRVIKSGAVGSTNAEEVKWLTEKLVTLSGAWKAQGWAYIVDISKMSPVTPDISAELVNLLEIDGLISTDLFQRCSIKTKKM